MAIPHGRRKRRKMKRKGSHRGKKRSSATSPKVEGIPKKKGKKEGCIKVLES